MRILLATSDTIIIQESNEEDDSNEEEEQEEAVNSDATSDTELEESDLEVSVIDMHSLTCFRLSHSKKIPLTSP